MEIKGFRDTINWYDNNSDKYAEGLYKTRPTDSANEFFKYIKQGSYVLEAGCGPGRETKIFTENGIKTVGMDLSEGLLEIARKNNPETEYIKGSFLDLPFEDKTFDGVWSHASLVHLETIDDVKKALSEFFRVTKNGGYVFVKVKVQTGDEKTAVVTDSLSNHDRFFRYYTPDEIEGYMKETGLQIISNIIRGDDHGRAEVQWIEVIAKKV